jgi:hypothetical protein
VKLTDAKGFVCSPGRNFVTLKIYTDEGCVWAGRRDLEWPRTGTMGHNPRPAKASEGVIIDGKAELES